MDRKEEEKHSDQSMPPSFSDLDYNQQYHHQQQLLMKSRIVQTPQDNTANANMVCYLLNNPQEQQTQQQQNHQISSGFCNSTSLDKLSFAEVMQFSDFGPKLALNQTKIPEEESGIDPVYFLKFPVLNDNRVEEHHQNQSLMVNNIPQSEWPDQLAGDHNQERLKGVIDMEDHDQEGFQRDHDDDKDGRFSDNSSMQFRFIRDQDQNLPNDVPLTDQTKKRKRPRTIKTSEEVESQRMTHIAVERNRRKQMNEHLRVLRSLMPGSYVQRGDQASIIGGAIEFVRELEQLLQCLESQKRRRLLGEASNSRQMEDTNSLAIVQTSPQPPFFPTASPLIGLPNPNDQHQSRIVDYEKGLREETAENKSCLADVEVKLLGFDAMIKILSRRRPGQLVKTIAALEDLQLNILHTNITTIEQTVLYSFNVKVGSESRFSAEDIASSVQQVFNFIHANSSGMCN